MAGEQGCVFWEDRAGALKEMGFSALGPRQCTKIPCLRR